MQSDKISNQGRKGAGRWTREEHDRFMLGLMQYGKNWKKVEEIVATRSGSQVRSHAQKFFNKLQKDDHQTKSKKQKNPNQNNEDNNEQQVSFNQNTDMLRSYDQDNSLATPFEIISLIKRQSIDNSTLFKLNHLGKVNLSSFKKSLQENGQKQSNAQAKDVQNKDSNFQLTNKNVKTGQNPTQNDLAFTLNSFKSMNNIISAYEALNQTDPVNHFQDESFLIGLTKKYKKYFSKGGHFENLIDFGNPHQVAKAAQIQKSFRKKSWTLAEGIQGDENDLEDIKKKLKQTKNDKIQPNIQNTHGNNGEDKYKKQEQTYKSAQIKDNQTSNDKLSIQKVVQKPQTQATISKQ